MYFCHLKSQVKDRFVEFLQWVRAQGHTVRELRTDGGGEYTAPENAQMMSEFQKIREKNIYKQLAQLATARGATEANIYRACFYFGLLLFALCTNAKRIM